MAQVKVVVSSGDARFELEGDQGFVESHLEKLLPLVQGNGSVRKGKGAGNGDGGEGEEQAKGTGRQTLKNFVKEKNPGNAYEAIAAVLHYKRHHEQTDELSGEEIRTALLQSGQRPPAMAQALTDCRRKYGYVEPGSKRGLWRLSNQGETVVEIDLPRSKATQ